MCGEFGPRVYLYVLLPIYLFVLHPVYEYVLRPIFRFLLRPIFHFLLRPIFHFILRPIYHFILRPIFLGITWVVGWISWLYGFRSAVMMQGLVCYWRAFLYFERSSLWEKLVEEHGKDHHKSYLIPLFWTMNGIFLIFIILLVLVTALVRENNVRRAFNIQGKIGVELYCLGKSIGEVSILRLMVYIGDHVADKSVAEIDIASCFVCAYLSVASLLKLCHVGNDLGFIDGIASVTLSIFTHYSKSDFLRLGGIFICGFAILVKNILFTHCCRPCSQAATLEDGGGGGGGGDSGGRGGGGDSGRSGGGGGNNGGRGGGGSDTARRRRGTSSGEHRISMDDQAQADYFYSATSSPARMSAGF